MFSDSTNDFTCSRYPCFNCPKKDCDNNQDNPYWAETMSKAIAELDAEIFQTHENDKRI